MASETPPALSTAPNATEPPTAAALASVLDVEGVSVRRGVPEVVRNLSFVVKHGTIHAITGQNGAGKSTLLLAILGLLPFSGAITLHVRPGVQPIGYVPQRFAPDRTLPVNVADFLAVDRQRRPVCFGIARETRARIEKMLAGVGLTGIEGRLLSALSGGQLQRVLLAHALDPLPELLILDEPGAGLDKESSRVMEAQLLDAKAKGVSTLLVSHDQAQVGRIADAVTEVQPLDAVGASA